MRAFAPIGSTRRTVLASVEIVESLLPADDVLVRALDATLALVVVTGDAVRWRSEALVAEYAIDETNARRLEALVLDAPTTTAPPRVHHEANPAALATTVIGDDVLDRRMAFARAVGWAPPGGPFVAVQASRTEQVADIARAVRGDEAVVVVPSGSDDGACAALAASVATPWVLPPIASVDDRVAVLHAAVRVVATDPAVLAITTDDESVAALEREYDAIAARLDADASGPLVLPEVAALRAALAARGRRLAAERLAFADALRAAHAERDHARSELAACAAARDSRSWLGRLRHFTGRR